MRTHGQVISAHTVTINADAVRMYTGHGPSTSSRLAVTGFVQEAVVGVGDPVEHERHRRPRGRHQDHETVTAPIGMHSPAPGQIDGGPHDE